MSSDQFYIPAPNKTTGTQRLTSKDPCDELEQCIYSTHVISVKDLDLLTSSTSLLKVADLQTAMFNKNYFHCSLTNLPGLMKS